MPTSEVMEDQSAVFNFKARSPNRLISLSGTTSIVYLCIVRRIGEVIGVADIVGRLQFNSRYSNSVSITPRFRLCPALESLAFCLETRLINANYQLFMKNIPAHQYQSLRKKLRSRNVIEKKCIIEMQRFQGSKKVIMV